MVTVIAVVTPPYHRYHRYPRGTQLECGYMPGVVAEWLNAPVLKTGEPRKGSASSNLAHAALRCQFIVS